MANKDKFSEYVDYLKGKGYSDHAARGIVGNLAQESSLDPNATNGSHRGLAQWDKKRWGDYELFKRGIEAETGKTPSDEYSQLDFIDRELRTNATGYNAYNKLKNAKTVDEATKIFQDNYEVAPGQDDDKRKFYANNGFATPYIGTKANQETKTYQGKIPETKLYTSGEFTGQRKYPPMTKMSGADFNQKPSITAKPVDMQDPKVTAMLDPYKKESKPRMDMTGTMSSTAPYISNVYNAFQKPAPVPQPVYNKPISLQRIEMNNDRYEANKDYRADILNADRTLDGNTSVGVKQFAKAQKFSNMSKINQQERNENLAISNKEIGINAGIQQGNNEMLYNYRTLGAERQNAIRTQQSANLANAADKFVAQQGVRNQYALEDRKLDILENTDEYGTNKRLMKKLLQPEEKKMGGSLGKYSAGSFMKKLKTVY